MWGCSSLLLPLVTHDRSTVRASVQGCPVPDVIEVEGEEMSVVRRSEPLRESLRVLDRRPLRHGRAAPRATRASRQCACDDVSVRGRRPPHAGGESGAAARKTAFIAGEVISVTSSLTTGGRREHGTPLSFVRRDFSVSHVSSVS